MKASRRINSLAHASWLTLARILHAFSSTERRSGLAAGLMLAAFAGSAQAAAQLGASPAAPSDVTLLPQGSPPLKSAATGLAVNPFSRAEARAFFNAVYR